MVRVVVQTGPILHDMAKEKSKPKRSRGQIETLPSGSLRVSLYAGTDPVTKDRMYLRETVPAGPNAEAEAGRILAGLSTRCTSAVILERMRRCDSSLSGTSPTPS